MQVQRMWHTRIVKYLSFIQYLQQRQWVKQLFTADGWPLILGDAVSKDGQGDAVAIVFVICNFRIIYI